MAKQRLDDFGGSTSGRRSRRSKRRLFLRIFLTGVMLTAASSSPMGSGCWRTSSGGFTTSAPRTASSSRPRPATSSFTWTSTTKLVDAIGRWPWPRSRMARLVEEIGRAKPKALAIDVLYAEPEEIEQPDRTMKRFAGRRRVRGAAREAERRRHPGVPAHRPAARLSSVESAIAAELQADLELTEPELLGRLRTRGFTVEDVGSAVRRRDTSKRAVPRSTTGCGPRRRTVAWRSTSCSRAAPARVERGDATLHSPLRRLSRSSTSA